MAVTVRLFAALRDAAGTAQVAVAPASVPTIVERLCEQFGEPFTARVAVASGMLDGRRVALDDPVDVPDGAELALLPPFSGGATVTAQHRRGQVLLLVGSLLVPALLMVGLAASRQAYGLVVLVVAVGTAIDLHTAIGATGVRTVLPATLIMGAGPAALLTLAPEAGSAWVSGLLAIAVMLTFLLAFASPRRQEAANAIGSTLLAGLVIAVGAGSLMVLADVVDTATAVGALALIAVTDAAVILIDLRDPHGRSGWRLAAGAAAAVVAAAVLYVIAVPGRQAPVVVGGLAVAALFAALCGARLHHVLRGGPRGGTKASALLIGTADAALLGAPLAVLWLEAVAA